MFTIMQQYCIVKCWAIYSWEFQSILKGQCNINGASDPRVGYTRAMQVKITILSQAVGSRLELQCLCPGHCTRTLPSEEEPPPLSCNSWPSEEPAMEASWCLSPGPHCASKEQKNTFRKTSLELAGTPFTPFSSPCPSICCPFPLSKHHHTAA